MGTVVSQSMGVLEYRTPYVHDQGLLMRQLRDGLRAKQGLLLADIIKGQPTGQVDSVVGLDRSRTITIDGAPVVKFYKAEWIRTIHTVKATQRYELLLPLPERSIEANSTTSDTDG